MLNFLKEEKKEVEEKQKENMNSTVNNNRSQFARKMKKDSKGPIRGQSLSHGLKKMNQNVPIDSGNKKTKGINEFLQK